MAVTKPAIQWVAAHSSNYTVGRSGKAIRKITFHHVVGSDDSAINKFKTAGTSTSSHFVVGDTKITQMVDLKNTAWTNANWDSNCESITIEHEGDWRFGYRNDKVIANSVKLVAWLRTVYPGISFNRHRDVSRTGTVCPGDLPVEEIWNKASKLIADASQPVPKPATALRITDVTNRIMVTNKDAKLWDLNFNTWAEAKAVTTVKKGTEIEVSAEARHPLGSTYLMTEYSYSKGVSNGFNSADLDPKVVVPEPPQPPPVDPTPPPVVPPEPENPLEPEDGETALNWLQRVWEWVKSILGKFKW